MIKIISSHQIANECIDLVKTFAKVFYIRCTEQSPNHTAIEPSIQRLLTLCMEMKRQEVKTNQSHTHFKCRMGTQKYADNIMYSPGYPTITLYSWGKEAVITFS